MIVLVFPHFPSTYLLKWSFLAIYIYISHFYCLSAKSGKFLHTFHSCFTIFAWVIESVVAKLKDPSHYASRAAPYGFVCSPPKWICLHVHISKSYFLDSHKSKVTLDFNLICCSLQTGQNRLEKGSLPPAGVCNRRCSPPRSGRQAGRPCQSPWWTVSPRRQQWIQCFHDNGKRSWMMNKTEWPSVLSPQFTPDASAFHFCSVLAAELLDSILVNVCSHWMRMRFVSSPLNHPYCSFLSPPLQDYPSLALLGEKLAENNIFLIFAVTKRLYVIYKVLWLDRF